MYVPSVEELHSSFVPIWPAPTSFSSQKWCGPEWKSKLYSFTVVTVMQYIKVKLSCASLGGLGTR